MDPHRLEQVLANVIGNAIKYSPEGGDVDITVREDRAAGIARLDVRDRGVGIPAAQQARVFGRFARADNATALGIKGTGLGLYITRELVERHGGRIWFDSVENQGTTFHLALPLLHADESAQGDEAAQCDRAATTG
jgi:signal transduction histidine kinase